MPIKDPNNYDWLYQLIAAVVGSIAKIAFDILSGKSFTLKVVICQVIVALYAGQLMAWIATSRHWIDEEKYCAISIASWLGAEMIKNIADRFKDKTGGNS
ncbi:hypothetical protein GYW75_02140 [Gilliamella sp. ESL0232]|uniref:hypothetical protein n=2 Tax=unclassified Gilliamella TaxID=2685620 RepID=UPI00158002AC|nr:hypothetical protein [Gilliamella sp. ESL0232]NUE95192.1 hypothetical protein [Gilliamella sp. ESL0232]